MYLLAEAVQYQLMSMCLDHESLSLMILVLVLLGIKKIEIPV